MVVPELAYPTYDVGGPAGRDAGGAADSPDPAGPQRPALVYVNSPSNPTGRILGVEHLRKVVTWAHAGATSSWPPTSYVRVGLGRRAGVGAASVRATVTTQDCFAVHSLSKTSSLAGYRAGFVAGDAPWSVNCWPCASTPA